MNSQLPECCIPKKQRPAKQIIGIFVLIFVLFFVLDRLGLLVFSPGTKTLVGLGSVFLFGIAASLSTCTVFSAGLLASLAVKEEKRFRRQGLFHLGRLIGFAGFGVLIGILGEKVTFSPAGQNFLTFAVSALLFFTGMKILGLIPPLNRSFAFFTSRLNFIRHSPPFLLGVLTFFLPCGFTQSAQLYALSLADPFSSATTMLVFAVGTLPVLLGVGVLSSVGFGVRRYSQIPAITGYFGTHRYSQIPATVSAVAQRRRITCYSRIRHFATGGKMWHNKIKAAAGALMMILGLSGFQNVLVLLNLTDVVDTSPVSIASTSTIQSEQTIEMTVYGDAYEPNLFHVKVGQPVRWKIFGSNSMGCAQSLVSRSLGISAELQSGLNEFVFTPEKSGTYGFSCAMGMVRGVIVVE